MSIQLTPQTEPEPKPAAICASQQNNSSLTKHFPVGKQGKTLRSTEQESTFLLLICLLWMWRCSRPAPCISHHQITTGFMCLGRNLTGALPASLQMRCILLKGFPYNVQRLRHPCAFSPSVICLHLGNGNVQQQFSLWKNITSQPEKSGSATSVCCFQSPTTPPNSSYHIQMNFSKPYKD